jgi:hypothetical protein
MNGDRQNSPLPVWLCAVIILGCSALCYWAAWRLLCK